MFALGQAHKALWALLSIGTPVWFIPREHISPAHQHPQLCLDRPLHPIHTQRPFPEYSFLQYLAQLYSLLSLQFCTTSSQPCSIESLWRNCSNPKSSTPRRPWGPSTTAWLMPPLWDWTRPAWIRWEQTAASVPLVAPLVPFVDEHRLGQMRWCMQWCLAKKKKKKKPLTSIRCWYWVLELERTSSHPSQPLWCSCPSTCPERAGIRAHIWEH